MADTKTRKILFTVATTYGSIPPVHYVAGEVVTLREDLAGRWLSRGVATDDAKLIAQAEAKAGDAPELIKEGEKLPDGVPADWRTLNSSDARALAYKLGGSHLTVQNRSQAMTFLEQKEAEANPPPAN